MRHILTKLRFLRSVCTPANPMPIVDTLKKLVKKTMEASSQDWEHVERVYHLSTMIAEKEGADVDLCQVTALLHDIGKVIGEPHNLTGLGRAKALLMGMSYPSQRIEHVLRIVENHSMDNWERLDSLRKRLSGMPTSWIGSEQ